MVGGDPKAFRQVEPILKTLAPGKGTLPRTPGRPEGVGTAEEGYLHCGPSGSGHFVKMVHNGIEYGLMQAYAEGFDLLKNAASPTLPTERRYDLPLDEIAELWRRGSVVSSWLLDLGAAALKDDPALSRFEGRVADSGEGRWALETAHELGVLAPVLDASLQERVRSREAPFYADKFLSALRERFGGHGEAPR
jgi:6-phosphogluconate dehydrogenase